MHQVLRILTACLLMLMVEHALSQAPSAPQQSHYIGSVRQQPTSPSIPSNISAPSGSSFSFALYGSGSNVWLCKSGSWILNNVNVDLINENNAHFDPAFEVSRLSWQPTTINGGRATYQSLLSNDTSSIITKPDSSVASPDGTDNISWERQIVVNTTEGGAFSSISYVLTVSTSHGVSPLTSTCGVQYQNNATTNIPFTATYYFYTGPPPSTTTPSSSTTKSSATRLSGIGQLGWVAIVGFISVGVVFF